MHIPDGFIDVQTSAVFAGLAAAGIATALKGARTQLDEKTAPLAGLTAVFIFAVQMLNFPVAAGTSGHLLGGALAAVLVGPWAATLALTVVLLMQGLLFADGGLTAIGLNVFNMGVLGVWAGYGIFLLLRKLLPKNKSSISVAAALGGLLSVPAAAIGFTIQYAMGATATFSTAINSNTGSITLNLTAAVTANIPAGRYVYDTKITDQNSSVLRILEGIAEVSPSVTR